jgi:predicted RecA/RadA family phage recombinase
MKNFIQNGDYIDFTAGATTTSGQVVKVGSLFGVSVTDVANGGEGTLALKGVFNLTKVTTAGSAVAVGGPVYRVTANGNITGASSNAEIIGYAIKAALDGDATVQTKLLG